MLWNVPDMNGVVIGAGKNHIRIGRTPFHAQQTTKVFTVDRGQLTTPDIPHLPAVDKTDVLITTTTTHSIVMFHTLLLLVYDTIRYNILFALENWQASCQFNLAHELNEN